MPENNIEETRKLRRNLGLIALVFIFLGSVGAFIINWQQAMPIYYTTGKVLIALSFFTAMTLYLADTSIARETPPPIEGHANWKTSMLCAIVCTVNIIITAILL